MTTDAPARTDGRNESRSGCGQSPAESGSRPERRAAVAAAIRDEAEALKERELDEALRKLDARGDLTAEERAAVESVADGIVGALLTVPARSLSGEADRSTLETALGLFGRDGATGADAADADDARPAGGGSR